MKSNWLLEMARGTTHRFLRLLVSSLFTFFATPLSAQTNDWQVISTGTQASLRAISAAIQTDMQSTVLWASGSEGTIIKSLDLGSSWQSVARPGDVKLDFRSLHAWNEKSAILASAGTPAIVLKTNDGGRSWREVFRDDRPAAFFDGLKFIDPQRGVLFGDPIDGRFCVFTTADAGESWHAVDSNGLPQTLQDEAAFAASNSAMIVAPPASIWIGTGGQASKESRVFRSTDFGVSWRVKTCPMISHKSAGIFSLAIDSTTQFLVAVGGDYQPDAKSATTAAVSLGLGENFQPAREPPAQFRSAVVYTLGNQTIARGFYAVGPTGTDHSPDGRTWQKQSSDGFHAIEVLPNRDLVAVGANGRFGKR